MLGYHREATYKNNRSGNSENMRRLFWTLYVFDKTMSLLWGRASNLQDFEIDAQHPSVSFEPDRRPWDESFIMGIKIAQLQGQIYDRLYSPMAMKAPSSEREQVVNEILLSLTPWRSDLAKVGRILLSAKI